MTKVSVFLDETKKIKRVLVKGHSNYDVYNRDIVCCSISVAMYMSANLISKLTDKFTFVEDSENAEMDLSVLENNEFIDIVMDNLIYTLKSIESSYADFLKIKINE